MKLSIQDHSGVEKGRQIKWLRTVFGIMFLALLLRGCESLIRILIFSFYRFYRFTGKFLKSEEKNKRTKSLETLPNVCDFQKENHTLRYGFKKL